MESEWDHGLAEADRVHRHPVEPITTGDLPKSGRSPIQFILWIWPLLRYQIVVVEVIPGVVDLETIVDRFVKAQNRGEFYLAFRPAG